MATATLPIATLLPPAAEGLAPQVRLDSGAVIDLEFVQSARVKALAYDEESSTLFAQFPNGPVYAYEGVEQDVYESLVTADSIGQFFNARIIGPRNGPAPYKYRKVTLAEDEAPRITEYVPPASGPVLVEPKAAALPDTHAEIPDEPAKLVEYAIAAKTAAAAITTTDPKLGVIVATPEHYGWAEAKLIQLKTERQQIEARVLRVYTPAYQAYVEARKLRDDALKPYDDAEAMLKGAMLAFHRKEESERRAAEAATRRQLEAEALDKAREAGEQEAARQAAYLEAQGEPEEAARVRAMPVPIAPAPVPAVVLPSAVPTSGKTTRKAKWDFRIVDEREIPVTFAPAIESLLREHFHINVSREQAAKFARSLGPIFAEFYVLDFKALRERACRLKSHANIAGVEVFDAGSLAVRK